MNIDLCVNKVFEVFNSKLLATYCKINPIFQKLALLLKNWNKKRFPDNSTRLNSFSIVLMLLAYMQSVNQLPNLQKFDDSRRGLTNDERPTRYMVQRICSKIEKYNEVSDCYFESNLETIADNWKIENPLTATQILRGFFAKYLFDYSSNLEAIDISADGGFRKISEAREIVNVCCHSEKCKKDMREKAWTFYILDPFDKGYNPAKSIAKDSEM